MAILSAKLKEKQRIDRLAEVAKISGDKMEVGWGSQIRSYVLAPYQLVRDERSKQVDGVEKSISAVRTRVRHYISVNSLNRVQPYWRTYPQIIKYI